MTTYGMSEKGINIKRLDVIVDEIHNDLSDKWGVNTKNNPESFLSHLIVNFGEKIAELWEFGEDIYHSEYPSSAEGISLDNVAQYGGSVREEAQSSRYPIHCKGVDGTELESGTLIKSDTNPAVELKLTSNRVITRNDCNSIAIKVAAIETKTQYYVNINNEVFSVVTGDTTTEIAILNLLKNRIEGNASAPGTINFNVTVDEDNKLLIIEAKDLSSSNIISMSENLTTDYVVSLLTFYTEDTGDIYLPNGTITQIVQASSGLKEINNRIGYIRGRDIETDTELRTSYIDKIFNRSSTMLESIKSAILENVQGVSNIACYENPSHEWDPMGRPPHSIEIIVKGGDSSEIANQIWINKAGGIATYADEKGRVSVVVHGKYDEDIIIFFGRPESIYCWYKMNITVPDETQFPSNGEDLLRDIVIDYMNSLASGEDVIPVKFISKLYEGCSGITDIDIYLFSTNDQSVIPTQQQYTQRSVEITARQLAVTTKSMIQIVKKVPN